MFNFRCWGVAVTYLLLSLQALASYEYNMPRGVTPISQKIYDLHMLIFYICVGIGLVVFSVLFYSVYHFRRSKGAQAVQFHDNLYIELLWTAIPVVIVILMLIPTVKVLYQMNDNRLPEMTVKITGIQWKWKYDYLDENIGFYSNLSTPHAQLHNQEPKGRHYLREVDRPLVVPIHTKVRLLFTSNDVNHSWWVPELGVKRDAIPGYITEAWVRIDRPGVYRGQCTEL